MELQRNHWIIVGLIAMNTLLFGSVVIDSGYLSNDNDVATNNAIIEKIMQNLEDSYVSGDDSYVIEVMYQPVIDLLGGKGAFVAAVKEVRRQANAINLKVVSWNTSKPYRYITTDERQYAIIDYEATMVMGRQRIQSYGYQLGIKDSGEEWRFIGGDTLNAQFYEKLFPDFPNDVYLPIASSKVSNNYQ